MRFFSALCLFSLNEHGSRQFQKLQENMLPYLHKCPLSQIQFIGAPFDIF